MGAQELYLISTRYLPNHVHQSYRRVRFITSPLKQTSARNAHKNASSNCPSSPVIPRTSSRPSTSHWPPQYPITPYSPQRSHASEVNPRNVGYMLAFSCRIFVFVQYIVPVQLKMSTQQTNVAPPVSMASISARSMGARRNRAGSSLRSKNSPLAGVMDPREAPDVEPRLPSFALTRPRGPCCWACCL